MKRELWSLTICLLVFASFGMIISHFTQSTAPRVFYDESTDVLTIEDLDWTFGSFIRSATDILTQTNDDHFIYDLNSNLIHVKETDTYDCLVGAYALVPVTNGHFSLSFKAKARADHVDAKNLFARLIDPDTKDAIQNVPIVSYRKDGSTSTDFHQFGVNFTLPGYTQIYLMFYYYDGWSSNLHQEFWITDLKIYLSGTMPISPNLSPQDFDNFNWTVGAFYNDDFENPSVPLTEKSDQYYDYSLNDSGLYIAETGLGCTDAFVGAYTVVPVVYGQLKFSFIGRVTADPGKLPFLIYRFYDPETYERISGLPDITFWTDASATNVSDTNFVHIEFSISLRGYNNVILLLGFNDGYTGNNNYQCWIKDFRVLTYDDFYASDEYHFDDFIWQPGVYDPYDQTLKFLNLQGVEFTINPDGMHFIESGSGTYYPTYSPYTSVGAYAVVPVINGWLNFSFIGNANSDYMEGDMIFIRIYDADTFKWINSSTSDAAHIGGIWNDRIVNSEERLVNSTIPLPNYTEVILFLFYNDFWSANHYQEFTISSFTIYKNNTTLFVDNDGDGLSNAEELQIGTSFWYNDTDSDGLTDYEEVNIYYTDPNMVDTDSDGLTDYEEVNIYYTDPNATDTDSDGLTDYEEVNIYYTDPNATDTDGDGLTDYEEVNIYYTDPNAIDTDGDGLTDYEEVNVYYTDPNAIDTDGDGLTDYEEVNIYYTDPNMVDTDSDGLTDYKEIMEYNTNPTNPDTDGDGYKDGYEVNQGTDPNNPDDYPAPTENTTSNGSTENTLTLSMPLNITILGLALATAIYLVKRKEHK